MSSVSGTLDAEASQVSGALPKSKKPPLTGYLWMTIAAFMFAMLKVMIRLASDYAPWAEVATVRTFTGAILAFSLAHTTGASLRIDNQRHAWGRSIFGTLGLLLLFYVLSKPGINVGDVAVLSATSPLFVALIAPFVLGEKSAPILWGCAAVSFLGIVLVAGPGFETAGFLMLVTLAHAISSGTGNLFMRLLGPHASAEAIVLHFAVVSCVVLGAIALWTWQWPSPMGWLMLGLTGLFGGLGQLAQTRAYALVMAGWIGIFGYVSTVFTQIAAVVLLGEKITLAPAIGSLLILGSGVVLAMRRRA